MRKAHVLSKGWPASLTPATLYHRLSSAKRTLQERSRTRVVQDSPHPLHSDWWEVHIMTQKSRTSESQFYLDARHCQEIYIQRSVYCHGTSFCLLMGGSSMTHNGRITDCHFFPTTFDYLSLYYYYFFTKCWRWRDSVAQISCCSSLFAECWYSCCYSCWVCITAILGVC